MRIVASVRIVASMRRARAPFRIAALLGIRIGRVRHDGRICCPFPHHLRRVLRRVLLLPLLLQIQEPLGL